jgi:asparagine synthase (glutamine-hydrolysing)
MCGILGWFGKHSESDVNNFNTALDTLKHRGPDDRGVFIDNHVALGHRRLSIVDLSSAGHQPMIDTYSDSVIVFNGEIYNYVEIRQELIKLGRKFISESDTEVLLHALLEWGHEALSRLNGMWSFAFWQPNEQKLLLARDRFGVKPLYYCHNSKGFAFASEPKALLSLFPEYREVNEEVLLDFLGNNLLYARGESFYQGIHVLPPAHYGVFKPDDKNIELHQYWDYPQEPSEELTKDEAVEQFESIFTDAVKLRLRSDVSVGLTLSGGLDSTGVLTAANNANSHLTCFTSVYDENGQDELPWAVIASDAASSPLVKSVSRKENWLETMKKIAWHMDGPGYSSAVYPLWNLMNDAKAMDIPVLLEGQGADEALAGYPQYVILNMLNLSSRIFKSIANVNALRHTFSMRWILAWSAREIFPGLLKWHRKRVGFQSLIRKQVKIPALPNRLKYQKKYSARQRLLNDHALNILPGLLHYGDSISMAHSVESRNPFLDYRLVEWMFKLPSHIMFNNNESKWVLREYLRKNQQRDIANRKDKKGYPTPVSEWITTEYIDDIEVMLLDPQSILHKWCKPSKIEKLIKQSKRGVMSADYHLYKLISTQIWLNKCIDLK